MELVKQNKTFVAIAATAAIVVAFALAITNQRSTTDKPTVQAQAQNENNQQNNSNRNDGPSYAYTAQPGDSYSQIARKAVQTYGIVNDVRLSQAQIIAAETNLTTAAGSPLLEVGQRVQLDPARVKSAIEAAQKLSAAEQAQWQAYVVGVDFNTDNVGE